MTHTYLAVALLPVFVLKYSNDNLTVIVEPTSGILRAAWARPLLTANLIDSYYHLLQEAEANGGCRFWHLDLRTSIWPAATFMNWLSDVYAPFITHRLGGAVYAACWVTAEHQPQVDEAVTAATLARATAAGFHLSFFATEPAARAWLLEQQA